MLRRREFFLELGVMFVGAELHFKLIDQSLSWWRNPIWKWRLRHQLSILGELIDACKALAEEADHADPS